MSAERPAAKVKRDLTFADALDQRPRWNDVNALTRRVWIVREGIWSMRVPLTPREYANLIDRLHDAATVIERMANGASRAECSPELDRVLAVLRKIDRDD